MSRVLPLRVVFFATLALVFAFGCASQYDDSYPQQPRAQPGPPPAPSPYLADYRYAPEPALVDVYRWGAQQQPSPLSVLVSIPGVRKADAPHGIPESIEVRMRLENHGTTEVNFDPGSLKLVTGTLEPLPPPRTQPAEPVDIAPGQTQDVTAFFPFPPGATPQSMDIDNLRLRWTVHIGGATVPQTAYFERVSRLYY